jgi:NADH-quinone oxidoreductase subunit L
MAEFFDFDSHPGNLYVIATLLPLASFFLLLLAGGVRAFLRSQRATGGLYQLLGGDHPRRGAAYVATGAMALAFVLSVVGFALFADDHHLFGGHGDQEGEEHAAGEKHNHDANHDHDRKAEAAEGEHDEAADRWAASIPWAHLGPAKEKKEDYAPGTLLQLGYRIDSLTAIMFLMVTLVATLIHIFSIGYMSEELQPVVEDHHVHTEGGYLHRRGRFGRFFMFLSLFCFSMLNLVLADNLFQVFVSWELVGICSYLLIGHYYERRSASNAANKAFITNRVGDAGFIIGLLILWTHVGTLDFHDLFRKIRCPEKDAHGERMTVDGTGWGGKLVRAEEGPGGKLTVKEEGDQVLLFSGHVHKTDLAGPIAVGRAPTEEKYGAMPYWLLVAAGLGVFLGCVGKSAQFPLQVWLPDAMEGPTPVSALIHAATMVAAGVYLVGRCFPLFTPEALLVIAYTGGITLFVAATIALVMTDIKKVLAYSTVSQLGYMMLALGVGGWVAGLFHLLTHAFFKALLFLCSGSVIYGCHHEQEMTKMGGLYPKMKTTALTMLIGVLAIAGTPLFSGWYSKDAILAQAMGFISVHPEHLLLFLLPLLTAGLTVFYMFRMWFMTFTGQPRDYHVYEHAHESPRTMTVPLVVLAVFSLLVAWGWPLYSAEESLLGGHHGLLRESQPAAVGADFGTEAGMAAEHHHAAEYLALGVGLLGVVFASLLYYFKVLNPAEAREQFPGVHRFLWHKWYFDELYSAVVVRPALAVAGWCRWFDTRVIDGVVDGAGRETVRLSRRTGRFDLGIIDGLVNLTARVVYAVGRWMRGVQTGYLRSYVLFMVLAAVGLFVLLLYFAGSAPAK